MTEAFWATPASQFDRAQRLLNCGFACFESAASPRPEELRYAEYEFQLYSMHAQWLAQKGADGVVHRAASRQVCIELQALTVGLRLGEPWNGQWDACLDRWDKSADAGGTYVCPVVIDRVDAPSQYPDENDPAGACDRENVWTISTADQKRFFFARDFSGMFTVADDDPAYRATPDYVPPATIFDEKWLFERRSFMQIQKHEATQGVAVQPWRACELLPDLLGPDAARIRSDTQWRRLYRVVKALSDIECDGFFDRLQGYDKVNLSVPLFHYTLTNAGTNKALDAELGGLLIWLERFDPALARKFANAGLSAFKADPSQAKKEAAYRERHWADDEGWGARYDAGSGGGCNDGARVTGSVSIGAGVVDSAADMEFLRMPHFHYRVTMLLRTLPGLRRALWKLAIHRLRNLAWLPLQGLADKLPLPLHDRIFLGQVLTSELAMAIVVRLHIFEPNNLRTRVAEAIETAAKAWSDIQRQHPDMTELELQAKFEFAFSQSFFKESIEQRPKGRSWTDRISGSNLHKLPAWPAAFDTGFGTRLRQSHLEGDGQSHPLHPQPPRLSWLPWSSPFWKSHADGQREFLDPVAGLDRDLDFAGDGHPAVPMRYQVIGGKQDFGALGTQVRLPAVFGKVGVDALTAQRVRESLAIRTASSVLRDGRLALNTQVLERRLHGDGTQFWARRHIGDMCRSQVASALRCASAATAPTPQDALWALDSTGGGSTLYAFDWRSGVPEGGEAGEAFASVTGDAKIKSQGDRYAVRDPGSFGAFVLPLQQKTFRAFELALGTGAGISHVDQFRVEPGPKGWTLTLAGVRQYFPLSGGAAVAPSEWGLMIEYLAWRHADRVPERDGWYGGPFNVMRDLGFDAWVPQPAAASTTFLRQAWPAVARGVGAPKKGEPVPGLGALDGLSLRCAPHLWNAPAPLQASSSAQITAAMLSWPSLYRMRRMFQDSEQARRGVYDLWRMGMRAALTVPLTGLKPVFAKQLPLAHQLFQSAESIAMLACWRYLDNAGLAQALQRDTGSVARAAKTWFDADAGRKDFRNWTSDVEHAFVWQALVPAIQEHKIRNALQALMPPLPRPARVYVETLGEVMDLQGLDSTAPPIPQVDYQAVLLRQPQAQVGLGLLAAPAPAPAALAETVLATHVLAAPAAQNQFWVGGIVPVLKVGAEFKAVPLMLPEPALVRLSQGVAETVQVETFWARDGAQELLDFAALDIAEPFTLEADISSWLGDLAQGLSLTLLASVSAPPEGTFALSLGLRLASPWLHKPLEWSRQVVDIKGITVDNVAGGKELVWRFPLADLGDTGALPVQLDSQAAIELGLGLSNGAVTARFSISASSLSIGLGSPVAALRLQTDGVPLGFEADLLKGQALVTYPDAFDAYLALELAALPGAAGAAARIVPTEGKATGAHVPPFDILLAHFGAPALAMTPVAARPGIDLSDLARPRIPAWLFESGAAAYTTMPICRLLDIAGQWLEGAAESAGAVLSAVSSPVIARLADHLQLSLPVRITVSSMDAEAMLQARCAVDAQGYLQLRGDSFACGLSSIKLDMDVGADPLELGSIAKLTLPPKVEAMLTLDGSDPGNCFRLLIPAGGPHPVLAVPASGGIKFDISEFALGSGGLTLAAKVSKDVVALDLPVLDKELAIQEPKDGVGEFHIVRGRLVSASLQAKVRLKVFDDADGVLTMRIVQDSGGLTIMAELDVGVAKTFHLRALYLQVIVASINLSLSYGSDAKWRAKGGLTGSIKFSPEGPMLGRLEEYRSLFDGTSVHFENMNLANLGEAPITVMVTPRTFDVGRMFAVTWRGFVLQRPGDLQAFMGLRLLGDITFKQRLPKMRVALTLGDISIRQLRADSLIPKIAISSIGVDIGMSGGFSFKGRITEFDDAYEYGFGGEVELRSEAFPATQAMIKLTRLKEAPEVPSIAVFASTERNDSLGYGFFLRKVGLGAGIHQGLRGFSDEPGQPKALTIAARVERALKDPRGLPYPAHLSSWQALAPGQRPEYVLVAYMQVTFGLLKPDVDHPLAASAVLAIDDNLDIIVGLNGWFVTSPDNTGNDEYIARPAIKGALALSPREQVLYGRFMTLPNSKFGDTANLNPMMRMLQSALDAVRLSVSMYADPRGSLIEVGWPRNARFETQLGPAKGWAEAGFRFGFYRGTQVVGLNLAVQAEISGGFSEDLGFANVSLSVLARFQLQASFAGAVTSAGQYYVLAEVMLSALLEISARAYKRIRIKGWGFSFTVTLFDVSVTLGISATAVLQTAIVPSGLGFNGSVEVHIRIAGFGIGARVRIGSSEGRIDEARSTIAALVPPIEELIQARTRSVAAAVQPLALAAQPAAGVGLASASALPAAVPKRWRCYALRVGADELRVVLFPDAEGGQPPNGYPPQAAPVDGPHPFVPRTHTLWLNPHAAAAYKGVVGHDAGAPPSLAGEAVELVLKEAADEVLLSHDWRRRQQPDAPRAVHAGDLLANVALETDEKSEEVVDPRTIQPVAGDFDDPAVLADPTRRSTRFRKRYGSDGVPTYDDHLRLAMQTGHNNAAAAAGATTSGELLMQLMNMASDAGVKPGKREEGPAPDDTSYSPHLLASRLGLVLSFTWTKELEERLASQGVAAIVDPGKPQPVMFGHATSASDWSCDAMRRAHFQIESGYYFEGKGEIGLVWSVVRTSAQGVVTREGPANHSGIAAFRVRRLKDDSSGLPESEPVNVIPIWPKYVSGGTTYYLRPQFQFHDSSLPLTGTARPVYLVEALADDGKGNTVLASQLIPVAYRAPSSPYSLVHAQAMLRLPPETPDGAAAAPAPYRLELLLHIDVDTRATPERAWEATPAELARLGCRIELFRHRVDAGVLGRYGQGHDGQVSVSWAKEDKASGIALPDTNQLRQLSITDLDGIADQITPLVWSVERTPGTVAPDAQDKTNTVALTCRARLDIRIASEQADWDRVLGAGGKAAELHVRLKSDAGGATVPPELASALLRCRIALTRDAAVATAAMATDAAAAPNAELTEGTEVAALERLPPVAAVERLPEWLPRAGSSFRAEVADRPFVVGGRPEDIGLRLRGVINYVRDATHHYGAVVGYRVWALDRLDADLDRRGSALADFLVEPEALFRATPTTVTVRQLAGGPSGQANWRFEGERLCLVAASAPALAAAPPSFCVRTLDGGNKVLLHASLTALADDLDIDVYKACLHADEPMWPAVDSGGDRLPELLARHVAASDMYGWRLLEALGGCATVWVASDDDRFGLELWDGTLSAHTASVVAVTFSRLQPGERPDKQPLALYGVRVFARTMLEELLAIAVSRDVAKCLAQPASHLAAALRLVAPVAKSGELGENDIPRTWIGYVDALLDRLGGFVSPADQDHPPRLRAAMWELGRVPALQHAAQQGEEPETAAEQGQKAQYPVVLPALGGQVHVFHTMENGYARELEVAVEVVRRYDIVAPRTGRTMPAGPLVHEVPVFRTQALEAERWAMAPDPDTGALTALVAVHSAQRLVLYRSDLAARVQFIEQKVRLQRTVAAPASAGWDAAMGVLGADFDREAYQASWVAGEEQAVPPLSEWTLVEDTPATVVPRSYDSYRYPDLPPFYAHGVDVVTQAGVRHSGEMGASEARPAMAEAMFTQRDGLTYPAPQLHWMLAQDGEALYFEFALVRGADALRPRVRAHWIARDQLWPLCADGAQADLQVPVLQLPDLRAQYRLVATGGAVGGPPLRVELVHLAHRNDQVAARVLVGPDDPQQIQARLIQIDAEEQRGRIGVACVLSLTPVERAWLRTALGRDTAEWSLSMDVQRDGVQYRSKGVTL